MALSNYTEAKILTRGSYYMTPLNLTHIDELEENLSPENKREIYLLGYDDIREALVEMYQTAQSYVVKKEDGKILLVGGLWFSEDQDFPQMFAMFTNDAFDKFTFLARGSRMLLNYLKEQEPHITMTILSDYEGIISWALWLGFEPVGFTETKYAKYVEFIHCNLDQNCVYDKPQRPVIH